MQLSDLYTKLDYLLPNLTASLKDLTQAEILVGFLTVNFFWLLYLTFRKRTPDSGNLSRRLQSFIGRLDGIDNKTSDQRVETLKLFESLRKDVNHLRSEMDDLNNRYYDLFTSTEKAERADAISRMEGDIHYDEVLDSFPESVSKSDSESPKISDFQNFELDETKDTDPILSPIEVKTETLTKRLSKTRKGFLDKIKSVFGGGSKLDPELIDELETLLITADLGITTVSSLLEDLKVEVKNGATFDEQGVKAYLKLKLLGLLERNTPIMGVTPKINSGSPHVILIVGVNGVGKTTTIAKLSHRFIEEGYSVVVGAADTFRAAATEQLEEWGRRIGVEVISGLENAKPVTVVFEAAKRAVEKRADILIIDTAGRLHTKSHLMSELEGINKALERHIPGAPQEVYLVLDGTTGQNALIQAKEFNDSVKLTGLIITKLDGSSKGGIVFAINNELGLPIRYIGVGEGREDLRDFDGQQFVDAMFDSSDDVVDLSVTRVVRRKRAEER